VRTVYIEGDSTTYGVGDTEMGGWANRLHVAALKEARGFDDMTMVVNRSLPGMTLPAILRQTEASMKFFAGLGEVSALVQCGMNEGKIFRGETTPVVPAKRFQSLVTQFCRLARTNDCAPVLVGPPPIDTSRDNPTFSGATIKDELLIEYGGIMRGVALMEGATYVDTRGVFETTGRPVQELLGQDGYHPNVLGHTAIANAVQAALPPL
jgi:lysophospholipase L1-like esterase